MQFVRDFRWRRCSGSSAIIMKPTESPFSQAVCSRLPNKPLVSSGAIESSAPRPLTLRNREQRDSRVERKRVSEVLPRSEGRHRGNPRGYTRSRGTKEEVRKHRRRNRWSQTDAARVVTWLRPVLRLGVGPAVLERFFLLSGLSSAAAILTFSRTTL